MQPEGMVWAFPVTRKIIARVCSTYIAPWHAKGRSGGFVRSISPGLHPVALGGVWKPKAAFCRCSGLRQSQAHMPQQATRALQPHHQTHLKECQARTCCRSGLCRMICWPLNLRTILNTIRTLQPQENGCQLYQLSPYIGCFHETKHTLPIGGAVISISVRSRHQNQLVDGPPGFRRSGHRLVLLFLHRVRQISTILSF